MLNLYEHQRRGLEETADKNRVAFYWDMGAGKTFVGSEKLKQLGGRVNLVVCQKSKIDDWVQHFKTYYPDVVIDDLTDKNQLIHFQTYAAFRDNFVLIGVINYELLFRRPE